MNIGEKLRTIRKSKGYSIYKLSQLTEISQNHISGVEQGKRQPTIETIERLIKPLGITISELFNDNNEAFYLSDDEAEIVKNFRALSAENADLLLQLSKALGK